MKEHINANSQEYRHSVENLYSYLVTPNMQLKRIFIEIIWLIWIVAFRCEAPGSIADKQWLITFIWVVITFDLLLFLLTLVSTQQFAQTALLAGGKDINSVMLYAILRLQFAYMIAIMYHVNEGFTLDSSVSDTTRDVIFLKYLRLSTCIALILFTMYLLVSMCLLTAIGGYDGTQLRATPTEA